MATFVIVFTSENRRNLDELIPRKFENRCYQLPLGEWVVAYDGTTRQLAEFLKIPEWSGGGGAIVLNFSGYWGRAPRDVWEWMKQHAD